MASRKTIAVDADLHAAWTAEAKRQGVPLHTYVSVAVERLRTGTDAHLAVPRRPITSTRVNPRDCKARLPAGTFCKACGTTHTKGS